MTADVFTTKFADPCPGLFYTYVHRRATDLSIFYVGKGKGRRAWVSNQRNGLWVNIARKNGVVVEIIDMNLSEKQALYREMMLIEFIKDIGARISNMTNGGDGKLGCRQSSSTKRKMAKSHGAKEVYCSNGMKFTGPSEAAGYLRANGHKKANASSISRCANNVTSSAYGYGWSYESTPEQPNTWRENLRRSRIKMIARCDGKLYESITSAASDVNGSPSNILACAKGRRNKAYGYEWSLVKDHGQ